MGLITMAASKGKGRKGRKRTKKKSLVVFYIAAAFILGIVAALLLVRYFDVDLSDVGRYGDGDKDVVVVVDDLPTPVAIIPDTPIETPVIQPKYRLAIVIDDMGRTMSSLDSILALEAPITIAVLPNLGRSEEVAIKAKDHGIEVLLHMPMEPLSSLNDPGKGAVFTTMTDEEVRIKVLKAVESVPGIVGINNHMGSKFTADADKMAVVLDVLKSKDLFFLDSRTTAKSVGVELARKHSVETIGRDLFLDNEEDQAYIEAQLRKAIARAKRKGRAVAIGHPYPETIRAISAVMGDIESEGVTIVSVSEFVR